MAIGAPSHDPHKARSAAEFAGSEEKVAPSALQESKKQRKAAGTRPKPAAFLSIADLIRDAYVGKRKRLKVTKADVDAMSLGPKLDTSQREDLLHLSASDRTLERTRELMLISAERLTSQPLSGIVRDFIRGVLSRHPVFVSQALTGVLENLAEAAGEEAAVNNLWSQSFADLRWPESAAPLKKNEVDQCRLNAVRCLLLWFREARGFSLERLQHFLYTTAWKTAASRHKNELQKLRMLMRTRDQAALGIACSTLERRATEHRQQANEARGAEERASIRIEKLEHELAQISAQLESEKAQIERLNAEVANIKREYENDKVHMHNEYEELRGRVLRRLRQEVSLLDEGLHALRRQPPKIHVMEDHAERAIEGLKSEIDQMKRED